MRYSALISILLVLTSCEKELDFRYHDVDSALVVEAALTDCGADILLTMTTPMGEPMDLTPITDAAVTLTDITTGETRDIMPDPATGRYTDATPGITGHEYTLAITHGSRTYSATSLMRPPTQILSLEFQWIKMPYDYVAILKTTFTDTPVADDCYWIRIFRNDEAYKWLLVDDRAAVNGIISEITMTSRKDIDEEDEKDILRDGDIVTVTVTPVSHAMLDYLTALQSNSNGPAMFAGDFCLGYFQAAPVARDSITYRPDQFTQYK
ncbi:MAG: hypothetical protein K2I64_06950 [Muribaculaceae bacterium]|nr:hypothetical protein [Muribaculaceae bacterium]